MKVIKKFTDITENCISDLTDSSENLEHKVRLLDSAIESSMIAMAAVLIPVGIQTPATWEVLLSLKKPNSEKLEWNMIWKSNLSPKKKSLILSSCAYKVKRWNTSVQSDKIGYLVLNGTHATSYWLNANIHGGMGSFEDWWTEIIGQLNLLWGQLPTRCGSFLKQIQLPITFQRQIEKDFANKQTKCLWNLWKLHIANTKSF